MFSSQSVRQKEYGSVGSVRFTFVLHIALQGLFFVPGPAGLLVACGEPGPHALLGGRHLLHAVVDPPLVGLTGDVARSEVTPTQLQQSTVQCSSV